MEVLLSGVVGSTAYGLDGSGSDVDRLGVFAAPTLDFARLHPLTERQWSVVRHQPDVTLHEAGKFCRLALACNPSLTELMWLPDGLYDTRTALGDALVGIRSVFLSAGRVRAAYLGYAAGQFSRLKTRGDGSFSADTRKRTAKHARHLLRLCWQGLALYRTGGLPIRVDNPDHIREFGERVVRDGADVALATLAGYEADFDAARSPLPDRPDEQVVEAWLLSVRRALWTR